MKKFKARQTDFFLILILIVFFIAGCGGGGQTGHWLPGESDVTAPMVTLTVPAHGATGVAINTKVSATFSEAMDPATIITPATFTLKQGATAVPGTVTYSGVTAVFTPTSILTSSTTYTATITAAATDLAGNALVSNYVWSFTTGAAPDTTAPTVTFTVPANGATAVLTNTKVSATFSEAMDPLTISTSTFTLKQGVTAIPGTVIYSGVTAVFTPASILAASTTYTATITAGATDLAGNQLAGNQAPLPAASDYVWTFTTGADVDTTRPRVILTVPANLATKVALNGQVTATFSKAMDPLTITTTTFTLTTSGLVWSTTVTYSGLTAVLTPYFSLTPNTTYTATITTGATDLAGNQLAGNQAPLPAASNYVWTFTTVDAIPPPVPPPVPPPPVPPPPPLPLPSCLGPGPVDMGAAANFAVLVGPAGGATLTNNGLLTTVNGDVGAASQVTPPTITAGYTNYTGVDAPYVAAKAAMLNAISCAAARPCGVGAAFNFGADHDFGGDTLEPGVYCVTGGMSVGSDLTLSTPGVYIFRSTGAMTSANTITVAFGGTANATNTSVFWVPTGAASIGTNNTFLGTIMPDASAATTLGANTTLLGRAMSNSDVTLSTNTITRPIP